MFMFPVRVQLFVAASYSSALALYRPPPATSTRPSASRTATWRPAGSRSVPAGDHESPAGSYNSAVMTSAPPTTSTRPSVRGVADAYERGVDLLAAGVQLPVEGAADASPGV